jgi:hypothetical protein
MHHFPLEGLEASYLGPCLIIQIPSGRDQNIRIVMDNLSRLKILNVNLPVT